jgi:hypothetical protein
VAVSEPHVAKAGRDCRAVESVVVQGYFVAGDTRGDGTALGKIIRRNGDYKQESIAITVYNDPGVASER